MVVAAFRATLEELAESDILLHVVDITHPKAPEQTEVVEHVLKDLRLGDQPRLLVINKMDLLAPADEGVTPARRPSWDAHSSVLISAAKGWNLDLLLQEVESRLIAGSGPSRAGWMAGSTAWN
jgi:GTP-binding protein HflX